MAATVPAGVAPFDGDGLDWFAGMGEENVAEYSAAAQGPEVYEQYVVAEVLPMLGAVPVLVVQVGHCVGHVGGESLAVGEGNHRVLRALPDRDWHLDLRDVEAPGRTDRHRVVDRADSALRGRGTEGPAQPVGVLRGEGSAVDRRGEPRRASLASTP